MYKQFDKHSTVKEMDNEWLADGYFWLSLIETDPLDMKCN